MRLALSESRVGLRARGEWISRRDPGAVGRKERKDAKAQRRKGIGSRAEIWLGSGSRAEIWAATLTLQACATQPLGTPSPPGLWPGE